MMVTDGAVASYEDRNPPRGTAKPLAALVVTETPENLQIMSVVLAMGTAMKTRTSSLCAVDTQWPKIVLACGKCGS